MARNLRAGWWKARGNARCSVLRVSTQRCRWATRLKDRARRREKVPDLGTLLVVPKIHSPLSGRWPFFLTHCTLTEGLLTNKSMRRQRLLKAAVLDQAERSRPMLAPSIVSSWRIDPAFLEFDLLQGGFINGTSTDTRKKLPCQGISFRLLVLPQRVDKRRSKYVRETLVIRFVSCSCFERVNVGRLRRLCVSDLVLNYTSYIFICQYFIFLNDKITKSIDKSYNFLFTDGQRKYTVQNNCKRNSKERVPRYSISISMKVFIKINQIKIHIICNTYMRLSSTWCASY